MKMVLYLAAGVIAIAVIAAILIIWKKRTSQKTADEKTVDINFTDKEYDSIIAQIKEVKKYKSILFTSAESGILPVTIPVNTAIGLAKEKYRCLLIDVDMRRDAVAKVFGLDTEQSSLSARAEQTVFENLCIWPAHKFSQSKQMNLEEIVEKAEDKFDFILLNAPALVNNLDRKQIISAAQAAFLCTKETSEENKLNELIGSSKCRVIGHIRIN